MNVAFDYGSRQEIVDSFKKIATLIAEKKIDLSEVNENLISKKKIINLYIFYFKLVLKQFNNIFFMKII